MYVSHVRARNLRCFQAFDLDLTVPSERNVARGPNNVTLLLGDNGSGRMGNSNCRCWGKVIVVGQQGGDVRLTNAAGFSGYPSIDWNGFQYGLSWQDDRGGTSAIYFAQVNAAGARYGTDLKVSSGAGTSSFTTALRNGSTYAFAWRDDRDAPAGNTELHFAFVGCP